VSDRGPHHVKVTLA